MYGEFIEVDVEVVKLSNEAVLVKVNGSDEEEWVPFSCIHESYPLMFNEGDTLEIEVREELAFKRGWI